MSAVVIDLIPGQPNSAELLDALLSGPFAELAVVVHLVRDAASDGGAIVAGESELRELGVTSFQGAPITRALIEAARGSELPAVAWCAVSTIVTGRGALDGSFLRFGVVDSHQLPLAPILSLTVAPQRLQLRFGRHGAPILAPPRGSIDLHPIEELQEKLARGLSAVASRARIRVRGESVAPEMWQHLRRSLGSPIEVEDTGTGALHASERAGPCLACRHANQGTVDLGQDRLLACRFGGGRPLDATCEVIVPDPNRRWFAFEPYDGGNCTWFSDGTLAILPD